MVYLVTYDMHDSYNYDGVKDIIKTISAGDYFHVQGSVWLIKTYKTPGDVYDLIQKCLHKDDKLLVIKVRQEWDTNSWTKTENDVIRSWF